MIEDRIIATKKLLEETTKLYEDGRERYNVVLAAFEKAKAAYAVAQATYVAAVQTVTNLDISQVSQMLPSEAPNLKEEAVKKLNLQKKEKNKAEKEVQLMLKYLNSIKDRIDVINKQLGIILGSPTLKGNTNKQKKVREKLIKQIKNKININDSRSLLKKINVAMIPVAKSSIIYTLSTIFSTQLKQLSKSTQQLSELVDKTNAIIQSVQTKQDVIKARAARDSALTILNKAERQLIVINTILKVLGIILLIFKIVLFIVTLYPIPTIPKIVSMIAKAMVTIDALSVLVGTASAAISNIIYEIQYQKSRLLQVSDVIEQAILNNLEPSEINELLDRMGNFVKSENYGKLGVIDGIIYRGFTFAIYEENDPKFVVAGNKRRYAVALDRSGFIVLYSQPSFTLDPEILIEQLKLQIEINNLES